MPLYMSLEIEDLNMQGITIVLPSLNPDEKLNMVVDGLLNKGFQDIVLVNDGSDEAHMEPFEKACTHPEVTLLTHEVNKGKGRALKTAFAYIMENRKDCIGVVTVDGDNQHTPKDILACAEMMARTGDVVFGCRNFKGPEVPTKNKIGNISTSVVLGIFCGIKLSDTQTGLRAIPFKHLELMGRIQGERFEYETEMIFAFKREGIKFREVLIDTVYIEDNASTHFDPLKDSLKIYRIIFAFIFSSGASCLIDYLVFSVLVFLLAEKVDMALQLFAATFLARVVSSIFNYCMNRKAVFRSDAPVKNTLLKYYALCIVQTSCSYGLVYLISMLVQAGSVLEIGIKIIVDIVLFLLSFRIQQAWVFR